MGLRSWQRLPKGTRHLVTPDDSTHDARVRFVQWVIRRANRLGFYIQHMDTGRYLSLDTGAFDRNSAMVWMGVRDYGCVFVFEPAANNTVL